MMAAIHSSEISVNLYQTTWTTSQKMVLFRSAEVEKQEWEDLNHKLNTNKPSHSAHVSQSRIGEENPLSAETDSNKLRKERSFMTAQSHSFSAR
jgi:hypothetical protein